MTSVVKLRALTLSPLSSFYSWNPAVHTDCSGLQASEYVCVGVAGAAAATSTGSTQKERARLADFGTANYQVELNVNNTVVCLDLS